MMENTEKAINEEPRIIAIHETHGRWDQTIPPSHTARTIGISPHHSAVKLISKRQKRPRASLDNCCPKLDGYDNPFHVFAQIDNENPENEKEMYEKKRKECWFWLLVWDLFVRTDKFADYFNFPEDHSLINYAKGVDW